MLKNNGKAPNPAVTLSDGTETNLSEFWQHRKLLLVFVRHFG